MPENQEEQAAEEPTPVRKSLDVVTQLVSEPKPVETLNMSVRNMNISLRERLVEVTLITDRSPPHVRHIVIRDGESRVVDDVAGSRIVETADGFEDIADEVKTFIVAVLNSAKKHGLA